MKRVSNGNLFKAFGVPPFSILDGRRGGWIARRKRLLAAMGETGESREGVLFGRSGRGAVSGAVRKQGTVSLLDPVLAELVCSWFGRAGFKVFDPFAGNLVFGYTAGMAGMEFLGLEIRPKQAAANQRRVDAADLPARYIAIDAARMDDVADDQSFDLLVSCPPYWNLERYRGPAGDLSGMRLADFRINYSAILANAAAKLRPDRFAALVVGEVRGPAGGLIGLVPLTIQAMTAAGLTYWNELQLPQPAGSAPLRAGRPFALSRKVCRTHQTLLVFVKGDARQAAEAVGMVRPPDGLSRDLSG